MDTPEWQTVYNEELAISVCISISSIADTTLRINCATGQNKMKSAFSQNSNSDNSP